MFQRNFFFNDSSFETERERHLHQVAYRDPITGYHNWNFFQPIITAFGYRGIQDYCLAHFDVKEFKTLNVVYGHDVANKKLTQIVDALSKLDWAYHSARCDNDNFVIMIKDMPQEELREKLENFFESISRLDEDENYRVNYRCGVVEMRNCMLLGNRVADAGKMAQHMGTKKDCTEVIFYSDEMYEQEDWAIKLKAYLNTAIRHDEFLIYLQPKYHVQSGKIYGAEALVRWKYQGGDLLSPAKFIPIFERDGSISKLDNIVLHKVCACLKRWKESGIPLHPISVNLSRKSMGNPNLINELTEIVDSYGVSHDLIDFELTESAMYDNQKYMLSVITSLKDKGFCISMDDFGTGYSSLSLLTTMEVDTLKIDKSFVDPIGTEKESFKERAVLRQIIAMAKELNLTCLTEGAEEESQVQRLKEYGCDLIQGFFFSRPLPVEEYEAKLVAE